MHELIVLQAADGSWELTKELASLIGRDLDDLRSAIENARGSGNDVQRAWATALALAWLEEHAAEARDEWRLLAAKAREWIDATPAIPPGGGTWMDAAMECLRV